MTFPGVVPGEEPEETVPTPIEPISDEPEEEASHPDGTPEGLDSES